MNINMELDSLVAELSDIKPENYKQKILIERIINTVDKLQNLLDDLEF